MMESLVVWDYEISGEVWRIGVTGGRVCLLVAVGCGCGLDRAMRRFAGWRIEWGQCDVGDGVAVCIGEFLRGERHGFPQEVLFVGSEFERVVWSELCGVGYGERVSYGELARRCRLGVGAARAVGGAVGRNPLLLFVPCHRVVRGAGGGLGGFSAGVDLKRRLLALEARSTGLEV